MAASKRKTELLRRPFSLETSLPYRDAASLWPFVVDRDEGELNFEHAPIDAAGKSYYAAAKRFELADVLKSKPPDDAALEDLLTRRFWMEIPWSR